MRAITRVLRFVSMCTTVFLLSGCCGFLSADDQAACKDATSQSVPYGLRFEPDTLWLVPGVPATARIVIEAPLSEQFTADLSISGNGAPLPAGITVTAPATINAHASTPVSFLATTFRGSLLLSISVSRLMYASNPNQTSKVNQTIGAFAIATTVQPFTLNAVPGVSVQQGAAISFPVTLTRAPGFTGDVTLTSASSHPRLATALTTGPTPVNNATGTVTVDAQAPTGLHHLIVRGTYKSFFDSLLIPITVTAPPPPADFNLQISPNALAVTRGASVTTMLNVSRVTSQVGAIQLQAPAAPAGITVAYEPNASTMPSSSITVSVAATVPARAYTFDVEGSWQGITRRASMTVTVEDPDFKMTLVPSPVTISRGATRSVTATLTRISPAIQAIDLGKQNEPPGIVATFPNAAGAHRETGNTTSVDVAVAASVPPGTYTFQIVGTALGVVRTADLVVVVTNPPITASLSPAALMLRAGTAGQALLSVSGLGYMQGVTVRVPGPLPPGILVTVSPLQTSFSNFVVDVTSAPNAAPGKYSIPIEVVFAGVTYTVSLSLTIN